MKRKEIKFRQDCRNLIGQQDGVIYHPTLDELREREMIEEVADRGAH